VDRPVGRPGYKPLVWLNSFLNQAASWKTARPVVAKVEFHGEPAGGAGANEILSLLW
jgi:hypothetical protein